MTRKERISKLRHNLENCDDTAKIRVLMDLVVDYQDNIHELNLRYLELKIKYEQLCVHLPF